MMRGAERRKPNFKSYREESQRGVTLEKQKSLSHKPETLEHMGRERQGEGC